MIFLQPSALSLYLQRHEPVYPGIELWWERRVEPDVASGIKIVFRFDRNFDVAGLCVIDLIQAKLCHLSLDLAVRGSGLGKAIMNQAMREFRAAGHSKIWCHGPEDIVAPFIAWSGAQAVRTLGTFGRKEIRDVEMVMCLWNPKTPQGAHSIARGT